MASGLPDNVEQLTAAACDGTLAADGIGELERLLHHSSAAQAYFLEYFRLDAELADHWRSERSLSVLEQVERSYLDNSRGAWRQVAWKFISHPTPLSLLVAALFVTSFVLSLALINMPAAHDGVRADRPRFAARMMRDYRAEWSADSGIRPDGPTDLVIGQHLELLAGVAEIRFDDGAVVLLEGPAELQIEGRSACGLPRGSLTAHVSKSTAAGFVVETPLATVTDLGTRFGVRFDPAAGLDLACFEGEIAVRRRSNATASQRLQGGQAASIPSGGGEIVVGGESARRGFTHSFPMQTDDGEVILFTRFDRLAGAAPDRFHWIARGLEPPGAVTPHAVQVDDGTQTLSEPLPLFDTPDARGHFAPRRNIQTEGPWIATIQLTVDAVVELQSVALSWRQLSNAGIEQTEERRIRLDVELIDSATQQPLRQFGHAAQEIRGRLRHSLVQPLMMRPGRQYLLTIRASGDGRGTNLGLAGVMLVGQISSIRAGP